LTVIGKLTRQSITTRDRLLAALLLAALAWGTTAEFTHHHGPSQLPLQTVTTSYDTGDSFESGNAGETSLRFNSAAECLICQLHQNLSTTLFSHAPAIAATEKISFSTAVSVILHRADFSSNQRGRAPPVNL
jgi:hypothetical protein